MEAGVNRDEQWHMSRDAALAYERYVARYILGPWAPSLVDAAKLTLGERVLDVACGTGVVARAASERVGRRGCVIGVDLNPGMIAVARSLPVEGAAIEWLERSALNLGMPDGCVDAVLCQQGLQFFPDKPLAMREMRRVLRADGRLALSVWNSIGRYNTAVGIALAEFVSESVAARFCASRQAPDRDELERLALAAGFVDVEVRVAGIDVHLPRLDTFALDHLSATPVAADIASASDDARRNMGAAVMAQLTAYSGADGVSYPEETYVLTASNRP